MTTLFHDGRVSISDRYGNGFDSPAEEWLPAGLDNLLAAQALFPMVSQFEMAGNAGENEVTGAVHDRIDHGWPIIAKRVRTIPEYGDMFVAAFDHISRPEDVTIVEIANAIGVSVKDVATMNSRLSGQDQSLNAPMVQGDGESADRQDFLVDDRPNQGEIVSNALDSERRSKWLKAAMTALTEREMRIVRERRLSEDGATLEALGQRLGISKERVRQIECRALEKLKIALVKNQPGDTAFV